MADRRSVQLSFDGDGSEVFALALKTGLLTFATLGVYRFWAKTRLRGYFWSRSRLDGDGLEYTGTGLEMFRGFLIAVVVLAVYMSVVQVVFYFIGLRFVINPQTEAEVLGQVLLLYSSFFALAPLMLFARYRSLRYKLVRTRFRGIRFGMESAAWAYAWRASLYLIATLCTLGLLHPLMRFRLEKFMADRVSFGDARLVQGGSSTELYGAMKHVFIGLGLLIAAAAFGAVGLGPIAVVLGVPGYLWAIVGVLSYQVQGFAMLTRSKRLDLGPGREAVTFASAPRTGSIIGYYILGSLAVGGAAAVVGASLAQLGASLEPSLRALPQAVVIGIGVLTYVAVLIFLGAVNLAVTTRMVLGHVITTTTVLNPDGLSGVRQRAGEAGGDAEGFADALDIGGAF